MCLVINKIFEWELGDEWGLGPGDYFVVVVWVVADTLCVALLFLFLPVNCFSPSDLVQIKLNI